MTENPLAHTDHAEFLERSEVMIYAHREEYIYRINRCQNTGKKPRFEEELLEEPGVGHGKSFSDRKFDQISG